MQPAGLKTLFLHQSNAFFSFFNAELSHHGLDVGIHLCASSLGFKFPGYWFQVSFLFQQPISIVILGLMPSLVASEAETLLHVSFFFFNREAADGDFYIPVLFLFFYYM